MPHMKRRAMAFLGLTVFAIFVLFVALILLMTRPARADSSLPDGITCELVREKVAEHGKAAAIAWAIEHGLSIRQIWLIRRTCKV
jgi:hypothetical protein